MKNIIQKSKSFEKQRYEEKVVFFDRNFGIIPFQFPSYDIEVSWFNNEIHFSSLFEIFQRERRHTNWYEKKLCVAGHTFTFDIKPVALPQRTFLNGYILSKFLQAKKNINKGLEKELHNAPDKVKFLEGRVEQFTSLINWTRQLLLKADDTSLRVKFLHIFIVATWPTNTLMTKCLQTEENIQNFIYTARASCWQSTSVSCKRNWKKATQIPIPTFLACP